MGCAVIVVTLADGRTETWPDDCTIYYPPDWKTNERGHMEIRRHGTGRHYLPGEWQSVVRR